MNPNDQSLMRIKLKIQSFVEKGTINEATQLLNLYSKAVPNDPDVYTLEATIATINNDYEKAIKILSKGIKNHPVNFDLLFNLAYLFEESKEYLEAYHVYMQASYISDNNQQQNLIQSGLERINPFFKGTTSLEQKGNKKFIKTSLNYGEKFLILKTNLEYSKERLTLLNIILRYLPRETSSILEIEFGSGIISKNLNYYGFSVEAIDSRKAAQLEVISKEWQENLRHTNQSKAKFYHNEINETSVADILEYDVIIHAANHRDWFKDEVSQAHIIKGLLNKAKKQLFIKLYKSNSLNLEALVYEMNPNFILELILTGKDQLAEYDFYVIKCEVATNHFSIPSALTVAKTSSQIFEVDMNKCIDKYGFSYSEKGFHPFKETILQYKENKNLIYNDSVLNSYYEKFQPVNMAQALEFEDNFECPSYLKKGWIGYPWLWDKNLQVITEKLHGETRPGGNHFFGPNTEEFGSKEMHRLISSYELIKRTGYLPELFADGYISGYVLIDKNDYRFIVTEGQHRLAALSALGYSKIKCKLNPSEEYPSVARLNEIKKWPQVQNRVYTKRQAKVLFNRLFALDGSERNNNNTKEYFMNERK